MREGLDEHERLIAVALRGRLGNQLFGFALARALSGDRPALVDNLMEPSISPLRAAVRQGSFRLITSREALRLGQAPRLRRGRRRLGVFLDEHWDGPFVPDRLRERVYRERVQGEYDAAVFELAGPVLLKGFFQNEEYFLASAHRIVGDLTPRGPAFSNALAAFRAAVGSGSSVAVVIRAGHDYEEVGWSQHFDWYRRAVEHVAAQVDSPRFAVFSDVPVAAEAMAVAIRDIGPAAPIVRMDAVTQMWLIAEMDHAVIAASSFAWWGVWLGDHQRAFAPDRVVVAPRPWAQPVLDGIPPNRWQRLDQ